MAEIKTTIQLRNDTSANWETNKTRVLKDGEVGVEFQENGKVALKIGHDDKAWSELEYFASSNPAKVYQVDLAEGELDIDGIDRVVGDATLQSGDLAIVKSGFAGDKTSYTSYVYDGSKWEATDGNYSASNVYLKEDITLAGNYETIGNYNKGDKVTAGTSLQDMFSEMLSQRLQPEDPTDPELSVTFNSGSKEVGTKIVPTYSATLSAGSYTYGPATGVVADDSTWSVVAKNGTTEVATLTTSSGSFDEITVDENTSYTVTVSVDHNEGAVALDNLGAASNPEKKIAAGTKSKTSSKITGYRSWFYGYKNGDSLLDVANLTSANIRALTPATSIPSSMTTNKMQQMFFAIPKGKKSKITVANSTNGAPQTVTKITDVMVEGANGFTAAAYDVWYVSNAGAESGQTKYTITVS